MKRMLLVSLALGFGLSAAGAAAQTRSTDAGVQIAQSARPACVSRCKASHDRCLIEIPVLVNAQGQRYRPADAVRACDQTEKRCVGECPRQ